MRLAILFPALLLSHAVNAQTIDAAFSPEAGAEALVLKVIDSAHSSIRLAGYSFTSKPIASALVADERRGIDVEVVVDEKDNRSAKSRAALGALIAAGVKVHVISAYAIHHDKYIIVDQATVETGSFNFTQAAARRNSENVIVVWNDRELAAKYLAHWQSRFDQGRSAVDQHKK